MNNWFIYIIEKKKRLYVGITSDLENRMRQHGHPALLYKDGPISRHQAVQREKTLKGWTRKKKLELIAQASSRQI